MPQMRIDSDRPTRFCRQCGAQLFVENEATSATTRQYAPQQSANPYDAPYQSQLAQVQSAPDRRFNNQTPDTSRLYPSRWRRTILTIRPIINRLSEEVQRVEVGIDYATVRSLVSGGISVMVISAIRAKQAAAARIGRVREQTSRPRRGSTEAGRACRRRLPLRFGSGP